MAFTGRPDAAGDAGHPARLAHTSAFIPPARSWRAATPYANNVAAVPSLHAAFSLLVAITLWPRKHKWLRPLVALYPLAMAFSLIYGAEHYFSDILLGWIYTIVAVLAARAVSQWWAARRERTVQAPGGAPGRPEPEPHPEPAYARVEQ